MNTGTFVRAGLHFNLIPGSRLMLSSHLSNQLVFLRWPVPCLSSLHERYVQTHIVALRGRSIQRRCDADRFFRISLEISNGNQIPYLRSIPIMPTRSLKRELACAWRFSVSSPMWQRSMPSARSRKITLGEYCNDCNSHIEILSLTQYFFLSILDPYNETRAAFT